MKPVARVTLVLAALALAALACDLGTRSGPPTLIPTPSATPQPTIGYATLSPQQLPPAAVTGAPDATSLLLNYGNQIESDRLISHVATLQGFETRHVNSGYENPNRGIGAAADWVLSQFESIRAASQGRLVVFPQPFNLDWAGVRSEARNIVAFLSGSEPAAGTLLIGAHYDSTGSNQNDGFAPAPGANDNGSGVAALLELARVLSSRPHRSAIMFVAFSAEEVGRRGSISFVHDYLKPSGIDVRLMINLDSIGSPLDAQGNSDPDRLRVYSEGPDSSPSREAARSVELLALNHVPDLELVLHDSADRAGRYSDHITFSEAGYPAFRLIQSLEDSTRQNNARDTIEIVQASYLTRVTRAVLAIVTALADGPRPPRNIALREAENGGRTLVWEPVPGASAYVVALRRPGARRYVQFDIEGSNSVTWDGFLPQNFSSLAIAARDANGLMGPLSELFTIR